MDATETGTESGKSRSRTSRAVSRCRGSSFWEKVTVADTLSPTSTIWIRGAVVSCTKAHSSPTSDFPRGTRALP
jgi:hypothetical protein